MTHALFISDLHLHATRPLTTAAFFRFLEEDARTAAQLFILGDLFESWVGDDQLEHDPLAADVAKRLAALAESGTTIFFMHGNRDFLIGERFASAAQLTLLPDPTTINVGGSPLLLLHGDTLCTDDVSYQQFRKQARDPAWQASILAKPYAERVALAQAIRERSTTEKATKAEDIMDVTPATVAATFRAHGYIDMIHGHTHRPATHQHEVDGRICNRTVLADWHDAVRVLRVDRTQNNGMQAS